MNKGIKAAILTSCVLLSAFVLFVSSSSNDVSAAEPFTFNGVNYDLIEGETNTATVTGCDDTAVDLVIEGKVVKDGIEYTVNDINTNAFQGKTSIKTVKIAFICKEIPTNAFNGCTNLESVEIAEGFTTINSSAFAKCTNLKKVVLPQTLTSIGAKAFSTSGVEEIDLKNVKIFGSGAFEKCKSLKSVDLTSAEALAKTFYGCSSLESCKLGSNLTSMSGNMFKDTSVKTIDIPASCVLPNNINLLWGTTSKLEAVNIEEGHKQFYSKDGVVYRNESGDLLFCPPSKTGTLYIDENVGPEAIVNSKLTNVVFSDRNVKCGSEFLDNNEGITEIFIPSNVTYTSTILNNCSTVTHITVGPGTKSISGFANVCSNLEYVDLPDTITYVEGFINCPKLDLCLPNSVTTLSSGVMTVKSISIPEGLTTLNISNTIPFRGLSTIPNECKFFIGTGDSAAAMTLENVRGKSFYMEYEKVEGTYYFYFNESPSVKYNIDGKLWYAAATPDTDFTPATTLVDGCDLKWFTDPEFKNPYVPGKVTENLQLYAQKQYTATFVDENGNKISEVKFTVDDKELAEPQVPFKLGYEGKWSYTIKGQNLTIAPEYTILEYNISFVDENGEVLRDPIKYTVETETIEMPEGVPKASDDKYTYAFKYWANNGAEFVFNAPMTGDFILKPYYLATAKAVKVDDSDSVVDAKDLEEVSVDITEEIKDAGLKVDLKDNASLRFKDVTDIVDKTLTSSVKKIENTSGVDGDAYSLSITVDGDRYTGEMEITLPYSPTDGKVPVVYWINGTEKVAMKIVSSDDKSVTFVTDHNSTYVVAEEESAGESDNTTLYIAVAAIVIVLIAAAILVARRH